MSSETLNFRSRVYGMVVTLALCLFVPALRAQTATENRWTGEVSNHWDEAGNWSEGHVPYSIETARIDTGTVSADTIGCVEVALNGGTLTITGSLNNLVTTVGSGATLVIAGDATHFITGTLTNHGAILWQGGDIDGDSFSSSTGHLVNAPDGVFDIWCDKSLGSSLSIDNQGAIIKSAGSTLPGSFCPALITSSGSIIVHAGNFDVGNIMELGGLIQVSSGASFRGHGYMRPLVLGPTSRFEGEGSVVLDGNITGTLTGHARLDGQLEGDLTIAPSSTVVIGDQYGDSSFRLTGTLTNHGDIIWQNGDIDGDSGSSATGHISNESDGVFDIWCDKTIGSFLTFNNQGAIYKNRGTNPNFTSFGAEFTSSGSISVRAGSLNLGRILDLSGSVTAADGTTIRLNTYPLIPATIALHSATTGTGDIRLSGNFVGTLSGQARLVMGLEGDLTIAPSSTVGIGDQYGDSTFRLTGTLTNHGTLLWQYGSIDGDSLAPLSGHIVNETDGVIDIWCDKSLGSALTFNNQGTIYKNRGAPASFSHFGAEFTNSGSISVRAGSLNLDRILDLAGSVNAADGTTIRLNACSATPTPLALHATTTGTGDVRLSGKLTGTLSGQARLVMGLEGDLTIAPASTVVIGDQYGDSSFRLTGTLTNHGTLLWQYGSIDGDSLTPATGHIVNETDGIFTILCDKSLGSALTFDNRGTIYKNLGTNPNFTSLGAEFTSSGSISVKAGSLNLEHALDLSGSVTAADGTTIRINAYSSTPAPLALHSSTTGTGDVRLSGNFAGTLSGQARLVMGLEGDLTIAPASTVVIGDQYGDSSFRLTGTLTNHGNLLWQYGSINGDSYASLTGHLVNETDGVIDLWCDKSLGSALTFDNRGVIYKTRGTSASIGCALTNSGRIELRSGTLSFSHTFQQTDGTTKLAGGNLSITDPSGLRILGGELTGAGAITGHVTLTGGSIIPGDALGTPLCIDGNLELAATATLVSTARGSSLSDFGRLVVSGNTVLDGNLAFSLGNGFVPALGHRFQVIRSSSISGSFVYSAFPAQPAATKYFVHYGNGFAEIVTGISSFADWKAFHFGAETDPAIIGDNADPDADGIANLLEYAFDLDPFTASRVGLPTIALRPTVPGGPPYLTMTFIMPTTITDLDFVPQVSGNLSDWLSGPGQTEAISDSTANGIRTVVVRDTVPVSGGARRFMRLQVQVKP